MNNRHDETDKFWHWFHANRPELDALIDPESALWDVVVSELQRLNKQLWFEMSRPNGDTREFIITAEGHEDAFPLVDAIVARAPAIPGWQFIALKPPMGFDFKMAYEGVSFAPGNMWFLPLKNDSSREDLGLRIGVPDLTHDIERQAKNAVLVILDTGLGERSAALDVQFVEVAALPENPDAEGYMELPELPAFIEWRKRKIREA